MSFHLTHITKEFDRVCPKQSPSRKSCTDLAPRLTLSPYGLKRAYTWPTSPRSSIERSQNDSHAHVHSAQTVHRSCTEINTTSKQDQSEHPFDTHHLGVALGAPKKGSMHVVHSTQTVHLSSTEINTLSKRTQRSFHLTHVTWEYHRACPKWFLSLWYLQHKLCTYLASSLTLSPNLPKWASTWPTSTRTTVTCAQKDFQVYGIFGTNHAPILRPDEHYL
jgi:hypothetical protein